jgi:hypothetical protein
MTFHGDSTIWNTKEVVYEKFDFYDDITYKNYTHIDVLVNGVDKQEGFGYIFGRISKWFKDWAWYIIKRILFFLICVGLLLKGVKLTYLLIKYYLKRKRNNPQTIVAYTVPNSKQDETLQITLVM